jgi:hypothetical protein
MTYQIVTPKHRESFLLNEAPLVPFDQTFPAEYHPH